MPRPVALIVLDGFGLAPEGPGNAVALADTPNFDRYRREWPHTTLLASGKAVGLPEGQIGNSEVGHMNLGAGRVVMQSLTYIQEQIESGAFFRNPVLRELMAEGRRLHLLGLVSRGGVHSDLEHLLALLELARREYDGEVFIHAFTDGRDTPPQSGLGYLRELEEAIVSRGARARVATVSGRYYAMDRDRRWERIERAYDAVVCGRSSRSARSSVAAIDAAYERGETDEFIEPTVITTEDGEPLGAIQDGDSVIFFNFRADRARQLTSALLGGSDWNEFGRCKAPQIRFASLMQYDRESSAPFAFELPELRPSLAEVISGAGLRQYHTAETEKYAHVTYFFNAKRERPHEGEEHHLVPSPKVATYDLKPEMSASELAAATVSRIRERNDDFILVNFANPDMVGHTGVLEAAVEACEASDQGMGEVVEAVLAKSGAAIVLADHGNAEVMVDEKGEPHTAHTTNPVPCILVGVSRVGLRQGGVLGDVAPTVLELLGVEVPTQMTGRSLLASD
ncbi:MAG TPA: 2,3-bisphosphoglycerate-independent phosphoglycerate mutase [Trueperaceae bacterium]